MEKEDHFSTVIREVLYNDVSLEPRPKLSHVKKWAKSVQTREESWDIYMHSMLKNQKESQSVPLKFSEGLGVD